MITQILPVLAPNGMPVLEHVYRNKDDSSKRKVIVTVYRSHINMKGYDYIYTCYAYPERAKEHLENHKCVFYL